LTLAAGGAVDRNVPTMVMGGECDSFAGEASVGGAYEANARGAWVSIAGAGHLAFSDLCDLKLDELGDDAARRPR
jgi:pimeloyl-ACP methyl ester carboxylesterase